MTWDGFSSSSTELDQPLADAPWWLRVLVWPVVLVLWFAYAWIGCRPDDGRHDPD